MQNCLEACLICRQIHTCGLCGPMPRDQTGAKARHLQQVRVQGLAPHESELALTQA